MIRENTFSPAHRWSKPFVSEVAEIVNLLKDKGYEAKLLASLTGMQEKKLVDWTARYKRDPDTISTIPYPVWCFLAALIGRPNIQHIESLQPIDARKVMRAFKPTAFKPYCDFVMPEPKEFKRIISDNAFTGLTVENVAKGFLWKPEQFERSLNNAKLPYLNWCLILMVCGFNIQKMVLNQHDGEIGLKVE
ncbi:hypothetical protein [Thaumasiovibrio sp. DFM-14]|uniref:hypothetical protein n=1 Tax=Thaumasiovibrio sp. DFM-14 TaxID=3384792 RepID=UPI00399FF8A8